MRRDAWAAAVDRLMPVATPPTVPWDRRAQLVDVVSRVALRRDPVKAHARKIRRARRRAGAGAVLTGAFGALAATVGSQPALELSEAAAGSGAAVAALVAVSSGLRAAELRRRPPPPPGPLRIRLAGLSRPPRDCPSRKPLDRLAERERALAGLLVHLGPAGEEPRAVAADAVARLHELGARITAVDRARRAAGPSLDAAVDELCGRLDAGVTAYGTLVTAAADAVAAGATSDAVVALRLEEATDSLAGLAAGLREVAG
jgi:hypothetical protein